MAEAERFSYHFGFHRQLIALFVVWSTPSPLLVSFRCPPSALYTFPSIILKGLARRCLGYKLSREFTEFDGVHFKGFPKKAPIIQKSLVYTNFTIRGCIAVAIT